MPNLGKRHIAFRKHEAFIQHPRRPNFNPKDRLTKIGYDDFIKRLTPYFSFPNTEIKRLINCVFHEILTCIREGHSVNITHFGLFTGQFMAGRVTYNIGLNQYNATPKIHQRCQPIVLPSSYAIHVCSPKNAFNDPAWYLLKTATPAPSSKILWFKNNVRFHKRALMIYDNPYAISGFKEIKYRLKESTGTSFPSETDVSEMKDLAKFMKDKAYRADRKVIRRFVLQDFKKKNICQWSYYNYLPGKYFVGSDNNFYMTEDEVRKKKTRYEVLYDRNKKNKKAFTDTSHLPEDRPDDLSWDYYEMEKEGGLDAKKENS